jgi:hypothetical protein
MLAKLLLNALLTSLSPKTLLLLFNRMLDSMEQLAANTDNKIDDMIIRMVRDALSVSEPDDTPK